MAVEHSQRAADTRPAAVLTVIAAAVLGASTWFAWWLPIALAGLFFGVLFAATWIRWIARRDARAAIALWLVFALNRSVALLVPAALSNRLLYLDDICLATAIFVLVVTGSRFRPGTREMTVAYVGLGVYAVSGVTGAVLAGTSRSTALLGAWLGLKLLVCLLVASQFRWRDRDIRLAAVVVLTLIVVVLGVAILQAVSPGSITAALGLKTETRLGRNVITSIFRKPAQYSTFMVFALAVLLAAYPLNPRRIGAAGVVGASALLSLRLKALIDLVALVSARVGVSPQRSVRARFPLIVLLGGMTAAYLAAGLLRERLGVLFGFGNESARQMLYKAGARIALDHFPVGGGFGSFGSEASISDYSPLYSQYGLSGTYGFRANAPIFLHDASWATVLGETGLAGLAGFVIAVAALLVSAWKKARRSGIGRRSDVARASLLFGLAFVSDSLTSPQLFAGFSCFTLAMLLAMSSGDPTTSVPAGDRAVARSTVAGAVA
jgi:hypothetical protein